MTESRVTIHMLAYNAAPYIAEAIESVLSQTFGAWTLMILDNGSTDNTAAIVSSYAEKDTRIELLQIDPIGISHARNMLLTKTHTQYVAVLDSDDVWLDQKKLEEQIEYLDAHRECVLVGTGYRQLRDTSPTDIVHIHPQTDADIRLRMLVQNPFTHSSVVIRSEAVEAGYDETLRIGDDYDLWLKLGTRGTLHNIAEAYTGYRRHTQNITKRKPHIALWNNLRIVMRHRHAYPNALVALGRRLARLVGGIVLTPVLMRNRSN